MSAARNPRTGRLERDPLTSPNWPVPDDAPTPIRDALEAEKTTPAPTPPPVRRVSWRERIKSLTTRKETAA